MTYFKVCRKRKPSPGGLNTSEKCVHCGIAFVDFADIFGDGRVLGCYVCGGLFLSRECREHDVREKKFESEEIFKEAGVFMAKCGKECKTLAGLKAHERKCKKCNE